MADRYMRMRADTTRASATRASATVATAVRTHRRAALGFADGDARDGSGSALAIVVAVTAILFLLATALILTATYATTAGSQHAGEVESVDLADAGLNAYLYQLRRDPNYCVTNPILGSNRQDGQWFVTATAATATQPITVRSDGKLAGQNTSSTIVAVVRFPTFADYAFLYDASPAQIAANTIINGNVRTNGSIVNYGVITGSAYAAGSISNYGTIQGGSYPNTSTIDFSSVTADMSSMLAAATAAGSYYPAVSSPYVGYQVTFNGSVYTVQKVKAPDSNGSFASGPPVTVVTNAAIPACGVLYFAGTVYVSGTYSTAVTICSSTNAYIIGNLTPGNVQSAATAGIVAQNNILIPTWFSSVPQNMTVTAALLAQTGAITPDTSRTGMKSALAFSGSMSGALEGWMSDGSHGFSQRTYTYDQRLDMYPPPQYPVIRDGSLRISTWVAN